MSRAAERYDVVVAGGGPAGVAATLAAASLGARVLVVERDDRFGGNVAQAFVHTICGLFLPSAAQRAEHAHAGIPRAFAEALAGRGAAGEVEWAGAAGFLPIDPAGLRRLAEELVDGRADRRMRARLTAVRTGTTGAPIHSEAPGEAPGEDSGEPLRLDLESAAEGFEAIEAWTLVDATGDASAAAVAGAPVEAAAPDELQHASYIVRIDGVDLARLDRMERARTSAFAARAVRRGLLDDFGESIVLRPAVERGCVYLTMNLPKPDPARFDPLDAEQMGRLELRAVAATDELLRLLAAERPAFRDARLGARPLRVGVRETRRVRGLERLEVDAVVGGRRRDDEACVTTWPVEIWNDWRRMEFRAVDGAASIPLGCLVADHPSRRIAMAGRCASASHEALGAIRVVATAMAMGEAAGVASAMVAQRGGSLEDVTASAVRGAIASGATLRAFPRA